MSHVESIKAEFRDLGALKAAASRLGGEFLENQPTYKWFGRHVGDYPLPQGFRAEDMGRCDHAIRFPGAQYEVGVVKRRDGKPGYTLLWDFWQGGYGLRDKIGGKGEKIVAAYGIECNKRVARRQGYQVNEKITPTGAVVLTIETGGR